MADPFKKLQDGIDESFSARFGKHDPFESLTMPSDGSGDKRDPFSNLKMPSAQVAPAEAARTLQQQIDRDMLPRASRLTTPIPEQPQIPAGGALLHYYGPEALDLLSKSWHGIKQGAALGAEGVSDIVSNNPLSGAGKVGLGILGTIGGAFEGPSTLVNRITGGGAPNTDVPRTIATPWSSSEAISNNPLKIASLGDRAMMLNPAPVAAAGKLAVKAIPGANALQTMVNDIAARDLPGAIRKLESNPSLAAMDVSDNVASKAMGISTGEAGRGKQQLFDVAARRAEESPGRLRAAFDEAMGPVPDTVRLLDQMKADVRRVGSEVIEPVLAKTGVVDVTPVVRAIDEKIGARALAALQEGRATPLDLTPTQQRLWGIRQDIVYRGPDGKPQIKDQYFLDPTGKPGGTALDAGAHGTQSAIRREADALLRSGEGDKRLLGHELHDIRQKLVEQIDKAGPTRGEYRGALGRYREEAHVQEAFDMGRTIFSKSKDIENRPEAWKAWKESATEKELAAARLGARVEADTMMGFAHNESLAGRNIPEVRFFRDKIETLFGKESGGKILREAEDEIAKARINAKLTANSKTAEALAGQKQTEARPKMSAADAFAVGRNAAPLVGAEAIAATLGGGAFSGWPTGAAAILGSGAYLRNRVGRAHDLRWKDAYAELASSTDPAIRETVLNALRSRQAKVSGGNKPMNALATPFRAILPQ